MTTKCKRCKYWDEDPADVLPEGLSAGSCRKDPPVVQIQDQRFLDPSLTLWPRTKENDWCGQFSARGGD
jgi:hypothetical protein